jgi:hypothetical protein
MIVGCLGLFLISGVMCLGSKLLGSGLGVDIDLAACWL